MESMSAQPGSERRLWNRFAVSRLGSYRIVMATDDDRYMMGNLKDFGVGGIGIHVATWESESIGMEETIYLDWCDLKPVMHLAQEVPSKIVRSNDGEIGMSFLSSLKITPHKLQEIYWNGKKKMETDFPFFVWNLFFY